jgi:uncharacterized protein (TIGR04255 family)
MGQFEPIHDAHAIEQMALALQVRMPLDDSHLQIARKQLDKFASELPAAVDLQYIQIGIGVMGPVGGGGAGTVPGRSRTKIRPDGSVEHELRVDRTSIAYRTTAYSRWEAVWDQLWPLFGALIDTYLESNLVASIALTFQDKFFWTGTTPAHGIPDHLLRANSPYIAPVVFRSLDAWHNHYGAFVRIDQKTKRLVNLNCDCLDESRDEGPRRIVTVTTALTDMLNQAEYEETQFTSVADGIGYFQSHVNQMHADCKSVFADVINDNICKRIGLTG